MSESATRPYHHGDLKRTLVDTAMAMLQQESGAQLTLREVARRAGVSHAAPYKHFPDKAALLAELSLTGFERLRDVLGSALAKGEAPLRTSMLAMADCYMAFARDNVGLYRLMFGSGAHALPRIHLTERAMSALEVLTALLARGQAAGLLRQGDVRGQAAACWALMHGLALLELDGLLLPEKVGPDPLHAALINLLEGLER